MRTTHNLGFLADADPLFCTTKGSFIGKVEARKRNESRILKSLKILAGVCPDLPLNSVHSSHKLVNYQINPGIRVPRLMGSWMAFVRATVSISRSFTRLIFFSSVRTVNTRYSFRPGFYQMHGKALTSSYGCLSVRNSSLLLVPWRFCHFIRILLELCLLH